MYKDLRRIHIKTECTHKAGKLHMDKKDAWNVNEIKMRARKFLRTFSLSSRSMRNWAHMHEPLTPPSLPPQLHSL